MDDRWRIERVCYVVQEAWLLPETQRKKLAYVLFESLECTWDKETLKQIVSCVVSDFVKRESCESGLVPSKHRKPVTGGVGTAYRCHQRVGLFGRGLELNLRGQFHLDNLTQNNTKYLIFKTVCDIICLRKGMMKRYSCCSIPCRGNLKSIGF